MFWVRKGSSPGPMRHHVRESFESPEWPTLASSTTTSSPRTRGAASCSRRNSPSPYCSELIPRRKTRPCFPIRGLLGSTAVADVSIMSYHKTSRPRSTDEASRLTLMTNASNSPRESGGLFAPIAVARASSAIAEQIRQAIITGQLGQGDRLPPERELAEQ